MSRKSPQIRLTMTRATALRWGLLTCECGHPENNHFRFDERPCAHCECEVYIECPRNGLGQIDMEVL